MADAFSDYYALAFILLLLPLCHSQFFLRRNAISRDIHRPCEMNRQKNLDVSNERIKQIRNKYIKPGYNPKA